MSDPQIPRVTKWERGRDAWAVVEGHSSVVKIASKETPVKRESGVVDPMKLDSRVVETLKAMFEERRQYIGPVCTMLGVDVSDKNLARKEEENDAKQ